LPGSEPLQYSEEEEVIEKQDSELEEMEIEDPEEVHSSTQEPNEMNVINDPQRQILINEILTLQVKIEQEKQEILQLVELMRDGLNFHTRIVDELSKAHSYFSILRNM